MTPPHEYNLMSCNTKPKQHLCNLICAQSYLSIWYLVSTSCTLMKWKLFSNLGDSGGADTLLAQADVLKLQCFKMSSKSA